MLKLVVPILSLAGSCLSLLAKWNLALKKIRLKISYEHAHRKAGSNADDSGDSGVPS